MSKLVCASMYTHPYSYRFKTWVLMYSGVGENKEEREEKSKKGRLEKQEEKL